MDEALSLKTGNFLYAKNATHSSAKEMLLVCPECGEPVYFKAREIPNKTPFFSHYQEHESIKLAKNCSLRIFGATLQRASSLIPGISQGQLVDRFQKSFCLELHNLFGKQSVFLTDFIRESNFINLGSYDYKNLIKQIQVSTDFEKIAMTSLDRADINILNEGLEDVCSFLRSNYGVWVGNFIYQTAYFLACVIHPDTVNQSLGRMRFISGSTEAVFVVEPFRLKQYLKFASEVLPEENKRNKAIPKIAAILISLLITKWRHPKATPNLFMMATYVESTPKRTKLPPPEIISHVAQKNKKVLEKYEQALSQESQTGTKQWGNTSTQRWANTNAWPDSSAIRQQQNVRPQTAVENKIVRPIQYFSLNKETAKVQVEPTINWSTKSAPAVYRLSSSDMTRVKNLVQHARTLDSSLSINTNSKILNKDELLIWTKCTNPFDAYFIAGYLKVSHHAPDYDDDALLRKLNAFIEWSHSRAGVIALGLQRY